MKPVGAGVGRGVRVQVAVGALVGALVSVGPFVSVDALVAVGDTATKFLTTCAGTCGGGPCNSAPPHPLKVRTMAARIAQRV